MSKLYTSLILIATAFFFMSNSGGRGAIGNEAVTGAPGETGRTCASSNCHDDGQFDTAVTLELLSPTNGSSKDAYKLGRDYTARLTISSAGTPGGYGFQMVALNGAGESVGEWTSSTGSRVVDLNNRSYIEQSTVISDPVIEFNWLSPSEDQGEVTFYVSANSVNGNGSPSGDGAINTDFVFGSDLSLATENELVNEMRIYPNPAIDVINIENSIEQNYAIYNTQGQVAKRGNLISDQISIHELESGMYLLKVGQNGTISRFVKL